MTAKGISKLDAKLRESKGLELTETSVRGVVYGKKQVPMSLIAERLDLQRIYDQLGHSVIFDLSIDGKDKTIPVLLHDVQLQPNSNKIIHFDLYAVTMDQKIKTEVPISLEGESPAQADSDKAITSLLEKLEIEALPSDLPEVLLVDISDLIEVGDTKYVSDIKIPTGVVILNEPEAAIVKIEEVQENVEPEPEAETSDEDNESSDGSQESSDGQSSGDDGAQEKPTE